MEDPRTVAERLTAPGDDLGAAAVLVAFAQDPKVAVDFDDLDYVRTLEREDCMSRGKVTPLGKKVARLLEGMGIKARGA